MEYTVTAGDTLQSIANRYSMSVQRLMEINNLRTDNDLRVGQITSDKNKEEVEAYIAKAAQTACL